MFLFGKNESFNHGQINIDNSRLKLVGKNTISITDKYVFLKVENVTIKNILSFKKVS